MDVDEAVLAVLREEGRPVHWTVIQDLALRRGLIDPFETPDVRKKVIRALGALTRAGVIARVQPGVYGLLPG
jgi:hypothetical protein